jgi:hypothetical protein
MFKESISKEPITDTTDFFSIEHGDEILIGGRRYIVTGHEREYRFGLDDPKFWVKIAFDADTDERKLIKLSYFEGFDTSLAGIKVRCFRNPEKEAKILELVKDHPNFMQGESYQDTAGNTVRVLDVVRGQSFLRYLETISMPHRTYCEQVLPTILAQLIKPIDAMRYLHLKGLKHGDIRNDHLWVEKETGNHVWIDFDYDCATTENPFFFDLVGIGDVLLYAVGKGIHELHMIKYDRVRYKDLFDRLEPGDLGLIERSRFTNIRKLYPYVPKDLNDILMHFSRSADVYYENVTEIVEDVKHCLRVAF